MKCVILDRDGTLIEHIPYLANPAEVRLLPTVREGIRALRDAGIALVLHTNQSGIGRGLFTIREVDDCNAEMLRQLGGGSPFHRICIAPERSDQPAVYRKPSPKLGQEIMKELGLGATEICYMGDNTSDLMTASHLGCLGIGVDTGGHDLRTVVPATAALRAFPVVGSFMDAVEIALRA